MPFNNLTIVVAVVVEVTLIHGTKQSHKSAALSANTCVFGPFLNCPIDMFQGAGVRWETVRSLKASIAEYRDSVLGSGQVQMIDILS